MSLSIICTIGIPGCGKTTICRALINSIEEANTILSDPTDATSCASAFSGSARPIKCILISFDDLQHLTTDECASLASLNESEDVLSPYKVFRMGIQKLVEGLVKYIKHGQDLSLPERYNIPSINEYLHPLPRLSPDRNVCLLLDDNMCYPSMRYSYYQLARKYGLGFGQIYFETPLDVCLTRNCRRSGFERIDEQVIVAMSEKLRPPDVACNSWEKHIFKVTNGDLGPDGLASLCRFVASCTEDVVPPLAEEHAGKAGSRISAEDVIHQSDLILRQLVKSHIASHAGGSLVKQVAAEANCCRKSLLSYLRSHAAELSDLLSDGTGLSCRNPESALYQYIQSMFLSRLQPHGVCIWASP